MSTRVRPFCIIAGLLSFSALAGCAMSDEKLATIMVAPGKFALYTCPEMVHVHKESLKRQREIEALMVKAGQGSGGRLVSAVAYRPEYLSLVGEMKDLRRAAAEKECELPDAASIAADDAAPPATGSTRR